MERLKHAVGTVRPNSGYIVMFRRSLSNNAHQKTLSSFYRKGAVGFIGATSCG